MSKMKRAAAWLLFVLPAATFARGVTPYLPLHLEPEIEAQIERVLILGGRPVVRRPIAAATVLDALPAACKIDHALCARVRRYLSRYTHTEGISRASIGAAASTGKAAESVIPNSYGMTENSRWTAGGAAYVQPNDYMLASIGFNSYQGHTDFTGSVISLGWDRAQLDIGYRPHWFSPMSDSSLLMSTEAATMPSVTLSNYRPLTRFGFSYEFFAARMSESDHIAFKDGFTRGHPRLAGTHLEIQPADGWSFAVNRLLQYGGGARGQGSLKDLFKAYFNPSGNQVNPVDQQVFGNQEASVTSTLVFPGRVPFSVYAEYGGEDTSHGLNYLLGNSALSMGIHFPRLWRRLDLTLEASEWQNAWYTHNIYQDGMTNYGRVTGNWFGDQRVFNDSVGGRSQTAIVHYDAPFGGQFMLRYRQLQNQEYGTYSYKRYQDLAFGYSHPWQDMVVGAQINGGRDVFGNRFGRLEGFLRYEGDGRGLPLFSDALDSDNEHEETLIRNGEIFVDAGTNVSRQFVALSVAYPHTATGYKAGYHFAVGARRFVSEHSDLGLRIEVDDVQNNNLLGVRLIDYRYRFNNPLALTFGLGAVRYNLATPAYGFYLAGGVQWRNLLPGWDLSLDARYADEVARDHLLPTDAPTVGDHNDSFWNILTYTFSISRHF